MSRESNLIKLEKDIRTKITQIKNGKITPKESEIGKSINLLKSLDHPLFEKIMEEYKNVLKLSNGNK